MGGSENFFKFFDLVQAETLVFLLILVRICLHCWADLHQKYPKRIARSEKWMAGFALCFLAALCSAFLYGFELNYAMLSIVFAITLGISCINPVYGLSFFISLLVMRPWEIMPPNDVMLAMPRYVGIFSILIWFFHSLFRSKINFIWDRNLATMLFLAVWFFLSTFKSGNGELSREHYMETFFRVLVLYLMISNCIKSVADVKLVRDVILFSASGLAAIALIQYFTLPVSEDRLRAIGSLENSNDLAAILIMVLPMAIRRLRPLIAVQMCVILLLTLAAVWLAQSRGAILAIVVMAASYFILKIANKRKAIALAGLVFLCIIPLRMVIHRDAEDIHASTESRIGYWKAGFKMAFYNPLLGVGYDSYPDNFERYADAIKYEFGKRTVHSTWILALAETGLPGFVALLSLFFFAFQDAYRIRREQPDLLICLIGYGVAITFLSHTYLLYPYILLALTSAAARVYLGQGGKIAWAPAPRTVALLLGICGAGSLFSAQANAAADSLQGFPGGDKPIGKYAPIPQALNLQGARGEVLNFLLRVQHKGCFKISIDHKAKSKGAAPLAFRFFSMAKIKTAQASFPGAFIGEHYDPLLPATDGKFCDAEWVWGEVEIARGALPEKISGDFQVGRKLRLPWEVEIWPMTMPEFPSLPAYAELTTWYNMLGHYGAWHEGEGELAQQYLEEMKRHRIFPLKLMVARPKPKKIGEGKFVLDIDAGKKHESFAELAIGNSERAFVDFPTFDKKHAEAESIQYWQAVEATIQEKKLQGRAICYFWDEPKEKDFSELIRQAKLAKQHAPSLKLLVTTEFDPRLEKWVDIFSPVMNYFGASGHVPAAKYAELRAAGREVWWYASCMSHGCTPSVEEPGMPDLVLDRPAPWIRSIGWLSVKYNLSAFLYYSVNNGFQFAKERNPWKSLWDFHGNGDGTLFYPGKPGAFTGWKSHGPIPSLRLKLWRETSFDAEYLRWMENSPVKPDWWKEVYGDLARDTKHWSKRYGDYQSMRRRIGEFLASQQQKN